MNEGFVKIYRSLLDWEWLGDANTSRVFIYLLLRANWKPNRWRGIEIKRGETLETSEGIARVLNMSRQSVRTAIFHLKSTGEITTKLTRYGMLVNIVKYAEFQGEENPINHEINHEINQESTRNQPGTNHEVTTLEEGKERKNSKKERIESKTHTPPTIFEVREFFFNEGYDSDPEDFYQYNEARKWKDKAGNIVDWKVKASDWERHEKKFSSSQSDIKVPVPDWWPEE